jgi:hypothetical protein
VGTAKAIVENRVAGSTAIPAAMVRFDPCRFEIEPVGGADTPRREQQHLGGDVAAVGESGLDAPARGVLDRVDGGAEPRRDIAVAQFMHELVDQFLVDEIEERRSRFDRGHREVERAEDGGVFDPDHAGADHGEAARQFRTGWCRYRPKRRRPAGLFPPLRSGVRRLKPN